MQGEKMDNTKKHWVRETPHSDTWNCLIKFLSESDNTVTSQFSVFEAIIERFFLNPGVMIASILYPSAIVLKLLRTA
jgi:hypothetical protein